MNPTRRKIVGVGLNKTGTSTLGACLRHWGFNHLSCSEEAFRYWQRGNWESLLGILDRHDSFEDWPWPLLYREIDERFPGSKFVLTTRRSASVWFRSMLHHARRTGPTVYRKVIYGDAVPGGHREQYIRIYEDHNQAVRLHFANRPEQLLEVCWETGSGWTELADFLELEPPRIPFPHENRRPSATGRLIRSAARYLRLRKIFQGW